MIRLLPVKTVDQALESSSTDVIELTPDSSPATMAAGSAEREPEEGSAFWPELDPRTRQTLLDRGLEDEVAMAARFLPEISQAVSKGFPIPPQAKERAVYETMRIMMFSDNPSVRLRAVEVLERMERSNRDPNTLPDQLTPEGSAPAAQVQVNIQNNIESSGPQTGSPSVTAAELVDELLSRDDVQAAIEADVIDSGEDYGI